MILQNERIKVRISKLRQKNVLGQWGVFVRQNLDGMWWDRGLQFRAETKEVAIREGVKFLKR